MAESLWPNFLILGDISCLRGPFFWCLVFDVFLAQFDLKENQSKSFAAGSAYARSGASSVAERARSDQLPARGARGFRRGPLERIFRRSNGAHLPRPGGAAIRGAAKRKSSGNLRRL